MCRSWGHGRDTTLSFEFLWVDLTIRIPPECVEGPIDLISQNLSEASRRNRRVRLRSLWEVRPWASRPYFRQGPMQ